MKTCIGTPKQFAIDGGKKDCAIGNAALAQKSIVDLEWPINECDKKSEFVQYVLDNIKCPCSSMVFVCPCEEGKLRQTLTSLVFQKYDVVQHIAFMD